MLVLPAGKQINKQKTRIVRTWLEACGWSTELTERRHHGDIKIAEGDPPYLLCGVDRLEPRLILAKRGFPFLLDASIGHGAGDFEGIQLRTIAKGQPIDGLWSAPDDLAEDNREKLLGEAAYCDLEEKIGRCGTVGLADAGVAVPFVGAAAGALTIAQPLKLASLEPAPLFFQIGLSAPEMATNGGLAAAPETNLGSFSTRW